MASLPSHGSPKVILYPIPETSRSTPTLAPIFHIFNSQIPVTQIPIGFQNLDYLSMKEDHATVHQPTHALNVLTYILKDLEQRVRSIKIAIETLSLEEQNCNGEILFMALTKKELKIKEEKGEAQEEEDPLDMSPKTLMVAEEEMDSSLINKQPK